MISFYDHVPIIVCGSRDGQPYGDVVYGLDLLRGKVEFNSVVVGSKRGTDGEAFEWALKRELIAAVVPAQWLTGEPKGRAAGPTRNARMPRLFPAVRAVAAFMVSRMERAAAVLMRCGECDEAALLMEAIKELVSEARR